MFDQADPATEKPAEQSATAAPAATETSSDPYKDLLQGIKTTDGRTKYATVSDALNAIAPAQEHIGTLEEELATLREELSARKSVEESLSQLTKDTPKPTAESALDETQVQNLVRSVLNQEKTASEAKQNQATVTKALIEKFGSKAEEAFYAKAKEIGVTNEFFNDLAAKSPAAVLRLMGDVTKSSNPTETDVNTEGLGTAKPAVDTNIMGGAKRDAILNVWRSSAPE